MTFNVRWSRRTDIHLQQLICTLGLAVTFGGHQQPTVAAAPKATSELENLRAAWVFVAFNKDRSVESCERSRIEAEKRRQGTGREVDLTPQVSSWAFKLMIPFS